MRRGTTSVGVFYKSLVAHFSLDNLEIAAKLTLLS
jgi:hypothetical protein